MYRLSYTQVSKQNRRQIETESDFTFAQIKKKQYFCTRIVGLRRFDMYQRKRIPATHAQGAKAGLTAVGD